MRREARRRRHDAGRRCRSSRCFHRIGVRIGRGVGRHWGSWMAPLFSLRRGADGGLSTKRLDAESDTELTGKRPSERKDNAEAQRTLRFAEERGTSKDLTQRAETRHRVRGEKNCGIKRNRLTDVAAIGNG